MFRLFVGLSFPNAIGENFSRLRHGLPGARWVSPENHHLTLRFIGEVDRHIAADIDGNLQRIEARPFDLSMAGLGTFGKGRKIRTLWVGAEASTDLTRLQNKIESAVVRSGRKPEPRKFFPHTTIAHFSEARPDRIQSFIQRNGLFRAGPARIDRFILFESRMGKGGSHYEELAEYPLQYSHLEDLPLGTRSAVS